MANEYDEDPEASGRLTGANVLTVVLPFVATIASLMFGIVIGGIAGWVIKPTQKPIEYMKTASLAELQLVCEPVVEEQKTQLAEVSEEIAVLRGTVEQKEELVAELRAQLEEAEKNPKAAPRPRPSTGGIEVSDAQLQKAKEELAQAKLELQMLRRVKDDLVEQLTRTQERLVQVETELSDQMQITEVLKVENDDLRDDNLVQGWYRFVYSTQLSICEKGNRKRTEQCREAVDGELALVKNEFVHCLRSGQAAPMARELDRGSALPRFAKMMDQDSKHLKGWYLQLCDPTLPELEVEDRIPANTEASTSSPTSFGG